MDKLTSEIETTRNRIMVILERMSGSVYPEDLPEGEYAGEIYWEMRESYDDPEDLNGCLEEMKKILNNLT